MRYDERVDNKESERQMITLNKNQQDYLEIITCQMKKTVEENNISPEYFQKHFIEIYTAIHNSYQKFLKGLLTDQEYKDRLFNKVWEELRA